VHELDDAGEHVGVGRRQDAVTEVEDVAGSGVTLRDDPVDGRRERLPRGEEERRVEVALDRLGAAEPLDRVGQRHAVVDPDDVGPAAAMSDEQLAGADPEVDRRARRGRRPSPARPPSAAGRGGRSRRG
jgi:hypothetical protein